MLTDHPRPPPNLSTKDKKADLSGPTLFTWLIVAPKRPCQGPRLRNQVPGLYGQGGFQIAYRVDSEKGLLVTLSAIHPLHRQMDSMAVSLNSRCTAFVALPP